jgi:hypothetical protein
MFVWLKEMLLWIPQKLFEMLLAGLGAIMESIPVPVWLANIGSFGAGIPDGVGYFLHVLKVPEGLAMIMGAYIVRFLIRRLPVIG